MLIIWKGKFLCSLDKVSSWDLLMEQGLLSKNWTLRKLKNLVEFGNILQKAELVIYIYMWERHLKRPALEFLVVFNIATIDLYWNESTVKSIFLGWSDNFIRSNLSQKNPFDPKIPIDFSLPDQSTHMQDDICSNSCKRSGTSKRNLWKKLAKQIISCGGAQSSWSG